MKIQGITIHQCIIIISLFCLTENSYAQNDIYSAFANLQLLKGTWSMKTKDAILYESWQQENDSTLRSSSFIVKNNDTTFLEHVELKLRNKAIVYIPTVPGQNDQQPVNFTLINFEDSTYIFENKQHDFPQRIIYHLPQNNQLHAWIEGEVKGKYKRTDYNYMKVLND